MKKNEINPDKTYDNMTSTFRNLIEKHAPLKSRIQRGNSAPFMTPELNRAIYTRSRLKKKFNKYPTNENKTKFKKQRNKCVSIRRKAIKNHFKKATENGLLSNQAFGILSNHFYQIKVL